MSAFIHTFLYGLKVLRVHEFGKQKTAVTNAKYNFTGYLWIWQMAKFSFLACLKGNSASWSVF